MAIITDKPQPSLPPPANTTGVVGWLRENLFSTPLNSVITIIVGIMVAMILIPLINWAFIDANWVGTTREDCTKEGACWVFINARFDQFMYGFFPESEYWRINLAGLILLISIIPMLFDKFPGKQWIGIFLLFIYPVIAYFLLSGSETFNLPDVETSKWGGLTLTLVLSLVGIVAALPLGILLALGRRSNMPIVKAVCIAFIEIWRGVPLITVLFMASVMLPLFLPEGTSFDKLLRAMIGIIMFQSAYMAEVVRSGLQAIPKGQYEAAEAMGLTYWQSMYLIILPQALKLVIPGIVNTFIALFKDTSLVLIIGLFDLLAIIQLAATDPNWLGYSIEGYVFAALVFWIFCFGMSRYSMALEKKLHTGHQR